MRTNRVKAALQRDEIALGTLVLGFNSPGIGPLIAHAGSDFVIFDTEHAPWSEEMVAALIAGARGI